MAVLRSGARRDAVPSDPLRLILWENIGYLMDDDRRQRLFETFEATVGFNPAAIIAADGAALLAMAKQGGMRPETRVERWRTIARIVMEKCDGDLNAALRALPLVKARALLKTFPVIGDPGADKVLLFSGVAAKPCLESNGLRVLARLGLFAEQASYPASYNAAITVLVNRGQADRQWLMDAYLGLREHGKTLCTRGEPNCVPCPLDSVCGHVAVAAL